MVVQHNITAMNANRYFGINNNKLSKSLEKLSSGYAINRAGDNAAGLAVSEKMRSQIAGMTQAVKNAQDGISMVQTYEGALTETDSILQRMKTLASQMANGGYDDPVDRTAAQQEFYQLNDELNQIADTDYNGVVVLNGGVMADGAVADANGLIDYANQPERAAKAWLASDVNTLDDSDYSGKMAVADSLWDQLGLSEETESVDITFKYNKSTDSWEVSDCSDYSALQNAKDNLTIVRGANEDALGEGATPTPGHNNGGFSVASSDKAANKDTAQLGAAAPAEWDGKGTGFEYANVVLDSSELKDGDTVTITFTRPNSKNTAPENIGVAEGTLSSKLGNHASSIAEPAITVNGGADEAGNYESTNSATAAKPMTEEARKAFEALNGAKVTLEYEAGGTKATKATVNIGGREVELDISAADNEKGIQLEDGTKLTLKSVANGFTILDETGTELASVTGGDLTTDGEDTDSASSMSFELRLDEAVYSDTAKPKASIETKGDYKVSESNAFKHSEAQMTYKDHLILQVGARTKDAVDFTFQYDSTSIGDLKADLNCTAAGLGTDKLNINTQEDANYAIDKIDQAINKVSLVRGTFGAVQNRLDHKIDNLNVTVENLTDAESRIRDTNMAEEMMNFTKNQILSQASQSMLAQANQLPQSVLQLLQ